MPGAIPVLSQAAEEVGLEWTAGDDLNFTWWIEDVDWSGTYTGQVFDRPGGRLLMTFTASAVYVPGATPPHTEFVMSHVDSTPVKSNGWWHLIDVSIGQTRFTGPTSVKP